MSWVKYKNLLQGHSHVAFLGWGYIATIGLIMHNFISVTKLQHKIYKVSLFIIFSVITLMLISFPLTGYGIFSIVLLSVFGITSYVLLYKILKDINGETIAVKLIKWGIYYYLISSLATWFLAGVIVTQGKTDLYYNTVYFYLHFLYNGFFVFAIFGLLFKVFEKQQILIDSKLQNRFFIFLNIACIPAYALSVLWSTNSSIYYIVGFIASILQLISLLFLMKIIRTVLKELKWNATSLLLLKFGLLAYSLKIIAQIASSFPFIVQKSLALKPFFIIGYLHLFTLAFMSVILLLLLQQFGKIYLNSIISKIGVFSFLVGVLTTELLIFLQGFLYLKGFTPFRNYNIFMFIFSFIIIAGLFLIFINQFVKKKGTL